MTNEKATTRPWIVTHQTASNFSFDIVSPQTPSGVFIASCGSCQSKDSTPSANASLIIKAVNNHEALLKACRVWQKLAGEALETNKPLKFTVREHYNLLNNAINQASK